MQEELFKLQLPLRFEEGFQMENGPNTVDSTGTMKEFELAIALFTGGGDTNKVPAEDPTTKEKKNDDEAQA